MAFVKQAANNKYYAADIPVAGLPAGALVEYYVRIAYDDHDTTFVLAAAGGTTSATSATEAAAQAAPFSFNVGTLSQRGRWEPPFPLPNVAVHAHVLPSSKVLMWGRRDSPDQSLNVDPPTPLTPNGPEPPPATCTPFIWDPATREATPTPQPTLGQSGTLANLFCSGHALLPDGRLLVAGGHLSDGAGLTLVTLYDGASDTWTPSSSMVNGRWYPTLVPLADGSVLILSGSYRNSQSNQVLSNAVPELWRDGTVSGLAAIPTGALDLFPRAHLTSDGLIHTTGSLQQTWAFDPTPNGQWNAVPGMVRDNAVRDYAPSIMYDVDRVIYVGGGVAPTANAELIDFRAASPQWRPTTPMTFPRRQHNATILPDGTVLVTGGTRGTGSAPPEMFNNLAPGQPVHVAELWDPDTETWSPLAAEDIDRCYHSTAVLLADGTVLSAGGGEFFPDESVTQQNDLSDSHRDAQLFSPPYLFRGPRPVVTTVPDTIEHGSSFTLNTDRAADVAKVTLVRLSSVTHSFNMGQRFLSLGFDRQNETTLRVTAPGAPGECPPGHYFLFVIDGNGVPSIGHVVRFPTTVVPIPAGDAAATSAHVQDVLALQAAVRAAAKGTKVTVGLTGACPYGIAACWGGANEGLRGLERVAYVDPVPDAESSTATIFLIDDGVPPLDRWQVAFRQIVNDSYFWRGAEVTLTGAVTANDGGLHLLATATRPEIELRPLKATDKVQWDRSTRSAQPVAADEQEAYPALAAACQGGASPSVTLTGPLRLDGNVYSLQVRNVSGL
jgi:galactose oxidase